MPETIRLTMKSIPVEDRPTEKLIRLGPQVLSDAELLAIIIRSGTIRETALSVCQRLLNDDNPQESDESLQEQVQQAERSNSGDGMDHRQQQTKKKTPAVRLGLRRLIDLSHEELQVFCGIGKVHAAQIKAALELGNRLQSQCSMVDRKAIKTPDDAIKLLESGMRYLAREEFRTILLDIRNRVIRICPISAGTLNASIVHPRDLFREAVKANAAAIILAHNHPSGDSTPSREDIETTKRFMEIGEIMGVRVVDHLVIAQAGSVSLRQLGLI
jgi:DNA repair protein RadC